MEDPNIVGDVGPTDIPPGPDPDSDGLFADPRWTNPGAGARQSGHLDARRSGHLTESTGGPAVHSPATRMDWTGDTHRVDGVVERGFAVEVDGRRVPGVLWTPPDAKGARPLVLIGHGATAHKRYGYVVALARELVRSYGFAAVAIDGAGHGDRRSNPDDDEMKVFSDFLTEWSREGSTDDAVADWRATLDAVRALPEVGDGPVGYWGLSMGTIFGLPLVAADRRIQVAVFGLMGLVGPTRDRMARRRPRRRLPRPVHPAVGRLAHPPGLGLRALRRHRIPRQAAARLPRRSRRGAGRGVRLLRPLPGPPPRPRRRRPQLGAGVQPVGRRCTAGGTTPRSPARVKKARA